ncbi:MAG: acyltransferase [Candidatus Sumerlaeia bacterium]|nr:acyltransferase [Candidatus Sumerlaeia bacterium]
MLKLPVKILWRAQREGYSLALLCFYTLLSGSLFRSVGWGTKFYGAVRFGSVENNITLGRRCMVGRGVFLSASPNATITIGDSVSLNTGCHVVASYGITIGENTRIGEYVSIRDQNHTFTDPTKPVHEQGFVGKPIVIGRDVWIGRGVFVGAGVEIGDGCVIGANSVVTKSLPAYSVAVGAPARVIRQRG